MKKWTTMIIGALLAVSLAACGNDTDKSATPPAGNETTTESNNTAEQNAAVPTLDELLAKTGEATKALKSFTTEANIDQKIKVDAGEQSQDQQVKTSLKMDIIKDPMMIYQEMELDMSGQKQNVKQYITSDKIYSQVGDQWVAIPEEQTKALIEQLKASMNPEKELDQFKKVKEDVKITEEGDNYVLNADVSGDNVKELAKSVMEQNGSDAQMQAMLDQMNIKSMKMKYLINKETSLMEKIDVEMVMEMEQNNQKMTMDMKMDTSFSNHDKVAEIKIPQEALDSAK
ncbi:hypothetical protein NKT34_19050 [Paenibacillus polysaccharolyticus]|uniref:Lipoprotein n=1 Tax=Paenibacillus cucumis (ex Kampfer et al. 2016) TaxID=1776858 RepID=A0ABS7KNK9_9BACL|nr:MULTISPECIES: DUF6612 family protein [Paenibacillus]MBY0205765.1 hypothetical protein [Paenibacillus cucumis (ex Kampfer et al. 2016)]MCP1135402.1 hypothetical protein [Paenibacillus polysaccharolyticus]MDP9699006.1 hypothetical protein [Paenibacillus intestini]